MAIEIMDRQGEDSGWRALSPDVRLSLQERRTEIDAIDTQLIALLAERFRVISEVGALKRAHGLPVLDANREAMLLAGRREAAESKGVDPAFCEELFLKILRESRRRQEDQLD